MPSNVILFTDYPSLNPKPPRLYCDTNFLIPLLFYNDNKNNPPVLKPRDVECYKFYTLLHQNNTELITSVYGFSELIHFYFFIYGTDGMYQVVKNFFSKERINFQGKSIHEKYKYFVKKYPKEFTIAWEKIEHRIDKAEEFLKQLGVKVLYPLPSPSLTNISKSIVEYASILLDAFPKLESNDAMHLAIAEYLNTPYVVSLDDAYKDVDGITVFSFV